VLVELGLVEQRHQAVLEVLEGVAVTEVALRYGVTRQTVHAWLRRYAVSGLAGLVDGSSRPESCPHQMPPEVEARIIALRLEHPGWGPRTLQHKLAQEGLEPAPGRSSIYRCLVRHRLVLPQPRKRRRSDYRRWERSRSMELWQMDVMGGVRLKDGTELKAVTGLDDHSRFCISAKLVYRATARPVCEALAEALRRYGVPDQILTDNGKVFTGRFGAAHGEVLFDRICRENGIRHLLTAPRSPTTTGKVERFHKTLRSEFLAGRTFDSLEEAQAELDRWVKSYNSERPHQGIGMAVPEQRFVLAPEPLEEAEEPGQSEEQKLPEGHWVTRVVSRHGRISLATFPYPVGTWLAGETVHVLLRDQGLLEIYHQGVLIACHVRRKAEGKASVVKAGNGGSRRPVSPPAPPPGTVLRKVDSTGKLSFAGTDYRVGIAYSEKQVEVRLAKDRVEIWHEEKLVRSHKARHDPQKLHGAFATPGGRPRKNRASS